MRFISITIFTACLFFSSLAEAAVAVKKDVPTKINSQRMEYSADRQRVVFSGKVHVRRPDFELWAEELEVHLDMPKQSQKASNSDDLSKLKSGSINRIVAKKNVHLKSGEKEGFAQKVTFYMANNKFVMEGSPRLEEKANTIKGEVITHYLKENRSEVKGDVEANFLAPDSTMPIMPNEKLQ